MRSVEGLWAKLVSGSYRSLLLSFAFGFVVRLIPELLLSPFPIGYDPVHYVWRIENGVVWYNWSQVFSSWLFYGVLIGLSNITRIDPFVLVKFTAAVLFGLSACGIYYFATRALGWTNRKGLVAGVFFSLQMAALALSANFYRNMLGLGILLFALPLIKNDLGSVKRLMAFVLLSVLVVFSHELSSVVLLASVSGVLISRFLKRSKISKLKVFIAIFPASAIFLALLLTRFYFPAAPVALETEKNVIRVETMGNYQGALFFLRNYLATDESTQYYPMALNLASQILSLFAGLYIVALPLVLAGFFKEKVLDAWTAMLLIGSFGALIMPFFALDWWYRWMLMLVYPFAFYAANGVTRVLKWSHTAIDLTSRNANWMKLVGRAVKLALILPCCLGLVFMTPAMQGSSVPLCDVDDTIRAMRWLDAQMDDDSTLLTHDVFFNWARLYLGERQTVVRFKGDVDRAINVAFQHGFKEVYFVWWNENIDSRSLRVPCGFASVFNSGKISVFEYLG